MNLLSNPSVTLPRVDADELPALPWEAGYESERCQLCASWRSEPDAPCLCDLDDEGDAEIARKDETALAALMVADAFEGCEFERVA
jgi:hypothetical protein